MGGFSKFGERVVAMTERIYTAKDVLIIKNSFTYLVAYLIVAVIAEIFQIVANVEWSEVLPPLIVNITCLVIAYTIYSRKKHHKTANLLIWILGFLTVAMPMIAKFKYGFDVGWTFALQSYNTSILMIVLVIMLQLQHNRRAFIFYSVFALVVWSFFVVFAISRGGEVSLFAMENGAPVTDKIVLLREIFFILMFGLLCWLSYRTIPVIDKYDEQTTAQRDKIQEQARAQHEMTRQIKEKMDGLAEQVNRQDSLTGSFNDKMQTQASTFEEISASLEELLGSAENISTISGEQVSGNEIMEEIINEFRNIKSETRENLEAAINDVDSVVADTSTANERISDIQNTIGAIRDQSTRIAETISMIVDIADQINLLSLNASIEAARAGDYGRGFAVVADEIGKLATQTTDSVKEIESVLSKSTHTTEEGVGVIRTTADMLKGLIDRMGQSSEKIKLLQDSIMLEEKYIKTIIDQMMNNVEMARNIGTGTEEQKEAIEASTKAIEEMNSVVSKMVDEIQDLTNTSRSIAEGAEELLERAKHAIEEA